MAQRILILAAGVGSGHNQAAAAIEAAVADLPEVEKVDRIDILETTNRSATWNRTSSSAPTSCRRGSSR